MLVDFEKLGPQARIWIYQSDKKLSSDEVNNISKEAAIFINQWTAHGNNLQGGFKIFYDQFLVLGVDENYNQASGCSVDASVHFLKELENKYGLSLFDRSKVALLIDDDIYLEDFREVKDKLKSKSISQEAKTFNNHITTKEEIEEAWIRPISDSWLGKYL